MGRFILFYLILAAVMGLAACAPQLDPEESCNFVQNSMQQRVSWVEAPLVVGVEDTIPSQFYPEIEKAMAKWEQVLGGKKIFEPKVRPISRSEVNSVNISLLWEMAWASTPSSGNSSVNSVEQAKTSISFQSDNIYRAVIFYNAKQNLFSVGKVPGHTDMASVTLHELGHALGLDHIQSNTSVMYPKLKTNTERMEPTDEDVKSLQCEY